MTTTIPGIRRDPPQSHRSDPICRPRPSLWRCIDVLWRCLPKPELRMPKCEVSAGSCGCDIPTPCWWPQCAGEVTSYVCPGGTATLRVNLRNVGPRVTQFKFGLSPDLGESSIRPESIALPPQNRGVAVFSVPTNPRAPEGFEYETVAWVRGCKSHYIRWRIEVTSYSFDACHEICIEDRPEYEHHWYDHFYCEHCCH